MDRLINNRVFRLVGLSFVDREVIKQLAAAMRDTEYVKDRNLRPKTWLQKKDAARVDYAIKHDGIPICFVPEPENPHSDVAVTVYCPLLRAKIGYLPENSQGNLAKLVTEALVRGEKWSGLVYQVALSDDYADNPGIRIKLRREK